MGRAPKVAVGRVILGVLKASLVPLRVDVLAACCWTDPTPNDLSSCRRALHRLERKGLVSLSRNERDRRAVVARLSTRADQWRRFDEAVRAGYPMSREAWWGD